MKIVKPHIGSIEVPSDKPKQLFDNNPRRKSFLIYNNGTAAIELLSSKDQKYGDGIPITAGMPYDNDTATGAFWIIAESGTQNARIEEDVEEECQD